MVWHYYAPLYWRTEAFLRKWRCGSNSERKLWTRFDLADFFLVWAESLFTLRTFGAQINWRIISRKILFDPHRFLSNKSPIHFAVTSGKGNKTFCSKTACSNWKWTSIATVRDHYLTSDSFPTCIVSRFHLPLKFFYYLWKIPLRFFRVWKTSITFSPRIWFFTP